MGVFIYLYNYFLWNRNWKKQCSVLDDYTRHGSLNLLFFFFFCEFFSVAAIGDHNWQANLFISKIFCAPNSQIELMIWNDPIIRLRSVNYWFFYYPVVARYFLNPVINAIVGGGANFCQIFEDYSRKRRERDKKIKNMNINIQRGVIYNSSKLLKYLSNISSKNRLIFSNFVKL